MRRMAQGYRAGSRFCIATFVVAFSLMTLASPLASVRPATDDVLNLWSSPTFSGGDAGNIEKYATAQVQPPYPPTAQKYRIEGTVTIQVEVSRDGKVVKAEFVRGHTVFRSVSLDTAKQWQFSTPNSANLEGTIDFTFKLKS
ncbi:MAG TPA: TonB family protein [Blastocatellia bacterium]|jgi:TonB family protein|nr:TonB family protein [Blastocatellia bacterium]